MRSVYVPTDPYQGALTVLSLLCYPDDARKEERLREAGMALLVRVSRRFNGPRFDVDEKALLARWTMRDMWTCLRDGNRRFVRRMQAVEFFATPKRVTVRLPDFDVKGVGGVNDAVGRAAESLNARNVRRSILEPTRSVMHLAIAVHRATQRWPSAESTRLARWPIQAMLLSAPAWLHSTVTLAALHAASWPSIQEFAPALATTPRDQLVRLLVEDDWPRAKPIP